MGDNQLLQAINHFSALIEDQNSKMDAVLEVVGTTQKKVDSLPTRDEFTELKQDLKIIKAAVTATNHDITTIDHRVARLEAA